MGRFPSWSASVLVAIALFAGVASVVRAHSVAPHAVNATAASRLTSTALNGVDTGDPAPQRMIPRPSPDPTPTPAPVAKAAPAVPARYVPPAVKPVSRPSIVIGSTQQALINRDRAANGLLPLTWSSCLASVARSNAVRMANQGYISHTNGPSLDLGCGLGHQAGENVGWWSGGINDSQLNTMFMNSPEHRANIMGPYRYVATAWAVAPNGAAYIAVEFS